MPTRTPEAIAKRQFNCGHPHRGHNRMKAKDGSIRCRTCFRAWQRKYRKIVDRKRKAEGFRYSARVLAAGHYGCGHPIGGGNDLRRGDGYYRCRQCAAETNRKNGRYRKKFQCGHPRESWNIRHDEANRKQCATCYERKHSKNHQKILLLQHWTGLISQNTTNVIDTLSSQGASSRAE